MEHLGFKSLTSAFSLGCLSEEHKTPLIRPGTVQDISTKSLRVTFRRGKTLNTSLQYLLTASAASIYHPDDLDFLTDPSKGLRTCPLFNSQRPKG